MKWIGLKHKANLKGSLIFLVVLLISFSSLSAQDYGCKKPSKKAEKVFKKAERYGFQGKQAYAYLVEATKIDKNYVAALSILAYINSKSDLANPQSFSRTVSYYEKTHEACAAYRNYEAAWWLAQHHYQNRNFDQAEKYLSAYLGGAEAIKGNSIEEAKALEEKIQSYKVIFTNPVPFNPQIVKGVSTNSDEYLPMLSPDNQYLFYTRKVKQDSKSILGEVEEELFFQSRKQLDGSFSSGIPMPTPFNKGAYQGGSSISIDNRLLFITIVNQETTRDGRLFSNGDIYYSDFTNGHWSDLKSIGSHINGRLTWEGQPSISPDNKTLYFASAREEDNYGGMDLYKTERREDGFWGPAINLGPKVNSSGNEKSPFIHPDGQTLYFSSDGHPGVGGQDIFYARMQKDGTFGEPKNIGVPINTEKDEHGFIVSIDGRYGFFSSNLGKKELNIYSFEIPEEARPEEVVFVRGKVASKDPDAAKGMTIELKNMTNKSVVEGVVNEENSEYTAVISARKTDDVMMMAKKEGYAFSSQYISADKEVVGKPIRTPKIEFNPIEIGESYKINDINFATNSHTLTPQVKNILDEFIVFLKENKGIQLAIHGHTDNVGNSKSNLELSVLRAKEVSDYLNQHGIELNRLKYKGFGDTEPIADNATEKGRAENRRTEFIILSK